MKNEHIIWAYAPLQDRSGQVLVIGLTDTGIEFIRAGVGVDKKSLVVTPPGQGFSNVVQVLVFHEKDKATLKRTLEKGGVVVSEVH